MAKEISIFDLKNFFHGKVSTEKRKEIEDERKFVRMMILKIFAKKLFLLFI